MINAKNALIKGRRPASIRPSWSRQGGGIGQQHR